MAVRPPRREHRGVQIRDHFVKQVEFLGHASGVAMTVPPRSTAAADHADYSKR
jgi:hypothetical protein